MKALQTMIRLAQQAVDREQRRLQELTHALAAAEQKVRALHRQTASEMERPLEPLGAGLLLQPFLRANQTRIAAETEALKAVEVERDAQFRLVTERRIERKRLEKLAENRARRAFEDAEKKAQKDIDDLVVMGWKRYGSWR